MQRKNTISTAINKSLGGIVIKSNSKSFGRTNSISRKFTKEKHLELHQITQENNNIECETKRKKSLNNNRNDASKLYKKEKKETRNKILDCKKLQKLHNLLPFLLLHIGAIGVPQQLLQCFDLVSNTQAIMSTKKLPEVRCNYKYCICHDS